MFQSPRSTSYSCLTQLCTNHALYNKSWFLLSVVKKSHKFSLIWCLFSVKRSYLSHSKLWNLGFNHQIRESASNSFLTSMYLCLVCLVGKQKLKAYTSSLEWKAWALNAMVSFTCMLFSRSWKRTLGWYSNRKELTI